MLKCFKYFVSMREISSRVFTLRVGVDKILNEIHSKIPCKESAFTLYFTKVSAAFLIVLAYHKKASSLDKFFCAIELLRMK